METVAFYRSEPAGSIDNIREGIFLLSVLFIQYKGTSSSLIVKHTRIEVHQDQETPSESQA